MGLTEELERAAGRAAENAGPSVVRIGRGRGRGAGVVVGDGVVLTNAHNVRGPETTVTFADGRVVTASVTAADVDGDLAVLAADTAGAPAVTWAPAEPGVRLGTPVFALANPAGQGVRVGFGTVSAVGRSFRGPRGRRVTGSVEHTAPLGRGSSGGPLVDEEGRLVGVNTHRLGEGFYLAQPADETLRARVDELARGDVPSRARLGVGLAPAFAARRMRRAVGLPERDGLLVRVVEPDSPAARAGLREGDLLVEADGRALANADDLFDVLDGAGEQGAVTLHVVRGVDEMETRVAFVDQPETGSA